MPKPDSSIIGGVCLYFNENGYPSAQIVFDKVIIMFIEKIARKVILHFDENFLALEQPHEMGRQGRRAKDAFKLWVDLNEPNSLPTMLHYLSMITFSAD